MESNTNENNSSIDVKDGKYDYGDVNGDTAPPELITDQSDTVSEDVAVTSEEDSEVDAAETSPLWSAAMPTRKKRHRAMSAEEEAAYIAALESKLAEFAPAQPNQSVSSSSNSKKEKALGKQAPSKLVSTLPPKDKKASTAKEAASPSQKKRRRAQELELEPEPEPPRPQKRTRKLSSRKTNKLTVIPLAVEALITVLSNTAASPTVKDVVKVVDAAADILDDKPNCVPRNAEIRALLAEEVVWEGMAARSEAGVKERMKRFLQRYGLIPMGGVEARESVVEATGALGESESDLWP